MMNKSLSQEEVIARLHKLGYADVSIRKFTDWKSKSLIPPFDGQRPGRGRARGRAKGYWSDGRSVIEQAALVYQLLEMYKSAREVYIPLWAFGYPVPLELVRETLVAQLKDLQQEFVGNAVKHFKIKEDFDKGRTGGLLEDFFEDFALATSEEENLGRVLDMPPKINENVMNIIFNASYDIEGETFLEGEEAIEQWRQSLEKKILPALTKNIRTENKKSETAIKTTSDLQWLFNNAGFIQNCFSTPKFKIHIENISDSDLREVQTDMMIIRKIAESIGSGGRVLCEKMGVKMDKNFTHGFLGFLSLFANILVFLDISLRYNGYGNLINDIREKVLENVQRDFGPQLDAELNEISKTDAEALNQVFKTLGRNFSDLALRESA